MWSRNQRHIAVKLFLRRITLFALLLLVLLAASSAWDAYGKERESRKLRIQAEAEKEDLLQRQAQLELDTSKLETDRGREEALRKQFSFAEQGEKLIVIVDPPASQPIEATSTVREWFEKLFWWF